MSDGVDYVAAKPAVLMGHHFSSIAGAGPINGPIQAAVFGWVPVFLWCVIGGIFFGGVHDFGALFASARHDGKSVGEIIGDTMGKKAKTLFLIFALLVLILVIASFVNVVAGTFAAPDDAKGLFATGAALTGTETTAMISMLFIVLAVIYGLLTNRAGLGTLPATILGLIASGTTAKQLDNEVHARPIGYGAMLIESALGIISLIAVGMVFSKYVGGEFGSPSAAFAAGIATMFGAETSTIYKTLYALLTLAVSVFTLTSLDSGTRLSRYMFSELFLKEGEKSYKDAKGFRKVLAYPLFGTLFMVIVGCVLGGLKLSQIWGLFGAANQLLAGLALMAVAAWLGNVGKNNKMFFFPMIFMLCATLTQLAITIVKKFGAIGGGTAAWGDWFQLIFALAMFVLAIILVIEGVQTFSKQKKTK